VLIVNRLHQEANVPHPPSRWRRSGGAVLAFGVTALLAACGTATSSTSTTASGVASTSSATTGSATAVTIAPETNAPGDIPDTTAYVPYSNVPGRYTFSHPEGWALTAQGTSVSFTDKYNGASASVGTATAPLTPASAQSVEVPKLQAAEPAFVLTSVAPVTLPAGPGVLIVYRRNSAPEAVTGRSVRQEVHRYVIYGNGQAVALDLFGAVGADNVDPYAKMSQSLRFP
jgi:hypothetical protein